MRVYIKRESLLAHCAKRNMTTIPEPGINTPSPPESPKQPKQQKVGTVGQDYLPTEDVNPDVGPDHAPVSMFDAMQLLKNQNISAQDALRLLGDVEEQTHKSDFAKLFCELGGFNILKQFAHPPHNASCRSICGSIMGNVVQQNPICQRKALDEDMLNFAFQLLKDDEIQVRRKGLSALSGLLRSCKAAQQVFVEQDGFGKLREAMKLSSGDEKFEAKVWFMLSSLARESTDIANVLIQQAFYEDAFKNIRRTSNSDSNEFILDLMIELTRPSFIGAFSAEYKTDFDKFLTDKLQSPNGNWTNAKVKQRASTLLDALRDGEKQETNVEGNNGETQMNEVPTANGVDLPAAQSTQDIVDNVHSMSNTLEAVQVEVEKVADKSYGIKDYAGYVLIFVKRGVRIPTQQVRQTWKTSVDDQNWALFEVYEGESDIAVENQFVKSFAINDIPRKLQGEVKFDVCMQINANGLLDVEATETSTGQQNSTTISTLRIPDQTDV